MQFRLLSILCVMVIGGFVQSGSISGQTNTNALSLDWSPDGTHIATGSVIGDIHIWEVESGALIKTLRGHTQEIMTLAWSPDNASIASGSPDGSVRIWDAVSGELRQTIQFAPPDGILRAVMQIDWSPDSKYIAGARETGQIIIWDALTGQEYASYTHKMWALTVSWHPSDDVLVSGGMDGRVLVWNRVTQNLSDFPLVMPSVDSIDWSPDGQRIAVTGGLLKREMKAQVFDFSTRTLLFEIPLSPERIASLRWSPDGKNLAISNIDSVRIVDGSTGRVIENTKGTSVFNPIAWSPYGGQLALVNTTKQSIFSFIDSVQIVVPDPSIDRLNAIAELCVRDAPTRTRAVTGLTSQRVDSLDALPDFVAQVESLPEGAIPAACRADLLAVAEALR